MISPDLKNYQELVGAINKQYG
jgi:hypothetical protein